jgi:hypothetical protein
MLWLVKEVLLRYAIYFDTNTNNTTHNNTRFIFMRRVSREPLIGPQSTSKKDDTPHTHKKNCFFDC